jgi:hypothetical protein
MKNPLDINELLFRLLENEISDEDFASLKEWLCSDPKAVAYYYQFIHDYTYMSLSVGPELNTECSAQADDSFNAQLWAMMAEHEKTAPANPVKNENAPQPVTLEKIKLPQTPRKVNTTFLFVTMWGVAALFFLILYLHFNPYSVGQEVATVSGISGAVWDENRFVPIKGGRIATKSTLKLTEGFAEIVFDNQARVTIQSPAEVSIEKDNQLFLACGKLSAVIPHSAIGFIVRTKGATVVDYGTEFGVSTHDSGDTEAHVFKGMVELRTGSNPVRFDAFTKLLGGQAGRINDQGQLSPEITKAQPSFFVRSLPAGTGISRPGHRLDLADIVGGGNGLGTGKEGVGIDPVTGAVISNVIMSPRSAISGYHVVQDNPLIDGAFVPIGDQPFTTVSSAGHQFECPRTNGGYFVEVSNKPIISRSGGLEGLHFVRLGGVQYGNPMHPAIMMHTNIGITFDLNAIRKQNPGTSIRRFHSLAGLSDTWPLGGVKADLWVVVDGIQRSRIQINKDRGIVSETFDIPIRDEDHFLTLIATDGSMGLEGGAKEEGDWTFFGAPVLELERANP